MEHVNFNQSCDSSKKNTLAISNRPQMFVKIGASKNFAIFTGKYQEYKMFSCEYCEIFKNNFFL